MATTDVGKKLRTMRVEREERLLDMAQRLNVSASFLSAIETGRKAPPNDFGTRVANAYGLDTKARLQLDLAVGSSRNSFMLKPENPLAHDTAALLARKINSLSDNDHAEIQRILKRGDPK